MLFLRFQFYVLFIISRLIFDFRFVFYPIAGAKKSRSTVTDLIGLLFPGEKCDAACIRPCLLVKSCDWKDHKVNYFIRFTNQPVSFFLFDDTILFFFQFEFCCCKKSEKDTSILSVGY